MVNRNKNPNASSSYKTLFFIIIVIILAIATAVASFFIAKFITEKNKANNSTNDDVISLSVNDKSQNTTIDTSSSSSDSQKEKVESNPQTPAQYEGENPNNLETLTGAISYIGETDNGVFSVRASIDQSINGKCEFSIKSPNGVIYSDIAETEAGPTSTFCVYIGSAPAVSGQWTASIKIVSDDGRTGTISGDARI